MRKSNVEILAKKIWDYHHIHHEIKKSDAIFVLCSHDIRVIEYAAELFLKNYAPLMIISGGLAHTWDMLETGWDKPEAEIFAERAIELGVPKEKIIIENKAQHTGDNVVLTQKILEEKNISLDSVIAVQKPYMGKRTYATIMKYWSDKEIYITAPKIGFEKYPNEDISLENLIHIMVGDLQRIKIYPEKWFQIYQEIPEDVWASYEELIELWYNKHLLK